MYEAITGVVVAVHPDSLVIGFGENKESVVGFSYRVYVSKQALNAQIDEKVSFLLFHQKGEYADKFYGFNTMAEKQLFIDLISCTKVGPSAAHSIMNLACVADIKQAIRMGQVEYLQRARGVDGSAKHIILKLAKRYANEHFEKAQLNLERLENNHE